MPTEANGVERAAEIQVVVGDGEGFLTTVGLSDTTEVLVAVDDCAVSLGRGRSAFFIRAFAVRGRCGLWIFVALLSRQRRMRTECRWLI